MRVKRFIRIAFDVTKKFQNVHVFRLQIKKQVLNFGVYTKTNESIFVKKDENGKGIIIFRGNSCNFGKEML